MKASMNPRPVSAAIASLFLLLSPFDAVAGSTATAAITNVRFGVLDLTPGDGTAAGFAIGPVVPSLFAYLYAGTADYYAAGYPGPLVPATVQLGLGGSSVSARTSGALADVASATSGDSSLGIYGTAGGSANEALHFRLRPHTVLTIDGHLSLLAARAGASAQYYEAIGTAHVGIVDGNGYTATQFARQSLSYADWPDRMTIEDDFTLAFANGSAEERDVSVYFQAVSTVTRIMPVPEPSSGALLCVGLLLLGLRSVSRRRAR
jgi:hypothetical protein